MLLNFLSLCLLLDWLLSPAPCTRVCGLKQNAVSQNSIAILQSIAMTGNCVDWGDVEDDPAPAPVYRPISTAPLSYLNHLTRRLVIVACGNLQSPQELYAQITRPLEFMNAAQWFFARQSPGMKRHREETPPPPGFMLTEFSPCVPVRVMCGCVATACRRLATAPAGVHVMYRTTGRWAAWIMERVTRGCVRRVQVLLQRRSCCAVRCARR